jgi:hypothetical protein
MVLFDSWLTCLSFMKHASPLKQMRLVNAPFYGK